MHKLNDMINEEWLHLSAYIKQQRVISEPPELVNQAQYYFPHWLSTRHPPHGGVGWADYKHMDKQIQNSVAQV